MMKMIFQIFLWYNSSSHEFTIFPHTLIDFARLVDQLTPAWPLAVDPISYIVITIRVDVTSIPMVDIVFKLTFINDMVNFLTNTLNSTINTNLSNDILIVLALSKLQCLVDWLGTVSNDIFQFERTQVRPFGLYDTQSNTRWNITIWLIRGRSTRLIL